MNFHSGWCHCQTLCYITYSDTLTIIYRIIYNYLQDFKQMTLLCYLYSTTWSNITIMSTWKVAHGRSVLHIFKKNSYLKRCLDRRLPPQHHGISSGVRRLMSFVVGGIISVTNSHVFSCLKDTQCTQQRTRSRRANHKYSHGGCGIIWLTGCRIIR